MVLRDAKDKDGKATKEDEEGSNASGSDGENCPECCKSKIQLAIWLDRKDMVCYSRGTG